MTEWENEQLTDDLIKMVNDHAFERKKILERLSSSNIPVFSEKAEIIRIDFVGVDKFVIKDTLGNVVGTFNVGKKMKSKIVLSGTRPVFVIFNRGNLYMQEDVMSGSFKSENLKKQISEKVLNERKVYEPMVNYAKYIYSLIDNKDYDAINSYINDCMAQLILANKTETSPKNIMDVYIRAQVLMRNIHNIKTKINQYMASGQDISKYISELDLLYRQICEIFINVGFYEIPGFDEPKITIH